MPLNASQDLWLLPSRHYCSSASPLHLAALHLTPLHLAALHLAALHLAVTASVGA